MNREALDRTLSRHGIQPSAQRLAVAEYVLDTTAHPSADRVFEEVRARIPMISRAFPSISMRLPTTETSAPNFRRQ